MFKRFNERLFLFEEEGTAAEPVEETQEETIEPEVVPEPTVEAEKEPKKVAKRKPKVEPSSTDNDNLKEENRKLKINAKFTELCLENELDVETAKLLFPTYEAMAEDQLEDFIDGAMEVLPKLIQPKKATPTPRIVPNMNVDDPVISQQRLHQKYFGNRGGL